MERPTRRWTRRAWLLSASAGVGALVGRQCLPTSDPGPSFPLADEVIAHDRGIVLNDASQLSPTPVASHITVRDNSPKAAVERVRAALTEARIAGHPFIASAARHSMGGQSLARDGTVVTLDQQWLEPDTAAKGLSCGRRRPLVDRHREARRDWLFANGHAVQQRLRRPPASGSGFISRASRYVFRAQVESDRAKRFRWWTEAGLGPLLPSNATRNTLMNEPVITLDDRDSFRTDILHEYFIGPARFPEFVKACQEVIHFDPTPGTSHL